MLLPLSPLSLSDLHSVAIFSAQAVVPLCKAVLPVWGVFQLFSAQFARER
jgi:hypothetical protein